MGAGGEEKGELDPPPPQPPPLLCSAMLAWKDNIGPQSLSYLQFWNLGFSTQFGASRDLH